MRKIKIVKSKNGLTLVEMMMVTALLSIFSLFLVNLVMISQDAWDIGYTGAATEHDAKQAMETMAKPLREATLTQAIAIAAPPNSSISFFAPDQVSQTQVDTWKTITFSYDAASDEITRTEVTVDGTTTSIFARNIEYVEFTQPTSDVVAITVRSAKDTAEGVTIKSPLTTQVTIRN